MTSPERKRSPEKDARTASALEKLALGVGGGILVALPFLQPQLGWLHWIALVPWGLLLAREDGRWTVWALLAGSYAYFTMAFGPFSALGKALPFFCGVILGPMMLPFAWSVRRAWQRRRLPLVLLLPVAWGMGEWIRWRFSIGQIGLYPLASSQLAHPMLLQIAAWTGAAGVSALLAAASGAAIDLWRYRDRRGWLRWWPAAAFGLLLAGTLAIGGWRIGSLPERPGPRVAVVQPNEVHYRDPALARDLFEKQAAFTRTGVEPGTVDLVAWPENAIDYPFRDDPYFDRALLALARELEAPVLAGAFTWGTADKSTLRTSALLYDPERGQVGQYDKLFLIPWAEYLPGDFWLARVSPALSRLHRRFTASMLGYFAPGVRGADMVVFEVDADGESFRFTVPICFEISNPYAGRLAVEHGAQMMINASSEGFFGAPLYYQMWAASMLRAVETGLPVIRVGNNGISGFIHPDGRPGRQVEGIETGRPYLEPGIVIGRVSINDRPGTFYSRFGDVFSYACTALMLYWALVPPRRRS